MPRKIKMVEVKQDDINYEDVVETVTASIPEEVEVVPEIGEALSPPPSETIPIATEVVAPEKPKKEVPMATCEGCGKTMTVKNLKYAHKFICLKAEEPEEVVVEEPIAEEPKPKKRLANKKIVIADVPEVREIPSVKKKSKSVPRKSAEPMCISAEPVIMKKPAALKAEKYAGLFEGAMM